MYSYQVAYQNLESENQVILDAKILEWEKSYGWKSERVVENFKKEHFLPADKMEKLMRFIIEREDSEFDLIKDELRLLIYNSYQLQGASIAQNPYPKTVGFATAFNEYKDFLMRFYGKLLFDEDENEVEKFIIDYTQGIQDEMYSECLFKHDFKLIWMTWDIEKNASNPFCFMQFNKSEEVTVTLGLDDRYFKPPLLLFYLDIDKIIEPNFVMYRPTFCDSDFYENFKPTPLDFKQHGLTYPLKIRIEENDKFYTPHRRPETVVRSKFIKLDRIEKVIYLPK